MPWVLPENVASDNSIAKAPLSPFEEMILKADRTVIPEFIWEPSYRIREPIYNMDELMLLARSSWVLKQIFGTIIRETLSPRWTIKPRFIVKCSKCDTEYDDDVKKCEKEDCDGVLVKPQMFQKKMANQLLTTPNKNRNDTFYKLIRAMMYYDLACDNYFVHIAYAKINGNIRTPKEIYVEDPRYIRIVCDNRGHLGDPNQLFCPDCWQPDDVFAPPITSCPRCGKPLERTSYVQRIGGAIKMRFTEDEMLHDGSERLPPNVYGESREIALYKLIISMMAMDDFNLELYTEGKLGSIVNFPGHDQTEVNEIMEQFDQETLRKRVYDPVLRRFRTSKKIRTVMIASKEPVSVTRIMEDFKKMQSKEFYEYWREACNSVYGVQPVFGGVLKSGKTGSNPQMQITVQDRAIKEYQNAKEDFVNKIFTIFKITDWVFSFNALALRDELTNANIAQITANTALTWLKAGFKVRLTAQGKLQVSGESKGIAGEGQERVRPPRPEKVPEVGDGGEINRPDSKMRVKADGAVTSGTVGILSPAHRRIRNSEDDLIQVE